MLRKGGKVLLAACCAYACRTVRGLRSGHGADAVSRHVGYEGE